MPSSPEQNLHRNFLLKAQTHEENLLQLVIYLSQIQDSLQDFPWFAQLEFYHYHQSEELNAALEKFGFNSKELYGYTFFIFFALLETYSFISDSDGDPKIIFVGKPGNKYKSSPEVLPKITEQWIEINRLLRLANNS